MSKLVTMMVKEMGIMMLVILILVIRRTMKSMGMSGRM